MSPLLGIDGGGTRTRAILVEASGRVLGLGEAGPSNYHNIGVDAAASNLRAAVAAAWRAAGQASARPARGAFLGLAGVKSPGDVAAMTAAAEGAALAPAGSIRVENDIHNALAGGLAGAPGIAVIGGTGCNALGRDASGATSQCGGWGWLLGDDGAGFGLAREALRAAARAADGRAKPTRLLPAALAYFGLTQPDELLARLYVGAWQPGAVAGFAPVVVRLAGEGDATARRVLREGAAALAEIVETIAGRLSFPEGPDVVLIGGCIGSGPPYQPMVEAAITQALPAARLRPARHSPVVGAALNALREAGVHPLPEIRGAGA